jgi:5-methylcytosine-specific restriction endonuclease McrA
MPPPMVIYGLVFWVVLGALVALAARNAPRPVPQQRHKRQHIPRDIRLRVYERCNGACVKCGSTYPLQVDHIKPLAKGGSNHESNLQMLCDTCNLKKGARY